MKKSCRINVRCTEEQMKKIMNKAEKASLSISEYALRSMLNGRSRVRKVKEESARQIVQLQQSLNLIESETKKGMIQGIMGMEDIYEGIIEIQEEVDGLWNLLK